MEEELYTVALHVAVIAALGAAGAFMARKTFRPGWFVGALVLYVIYDALLTRGFWTAPNLFPGLDWNWTGKGLALAGMLIVAAIPGFGWRRTGVTFRQASGSVSAWIVFALLSAAFFALAIATGDGRPDDLETIAFQWTMPGLDEELFYRGVLLLALNEAFAARLPIAGAPIGYGGLLTSVLFGLVHALFYSEGRVDFDLAAFAMTGGPSVLLLWLREKTASLFLPAMAHNIANGAFTLF